LTGAKGPKEESKTKKKKRANTKLFLRCLFYKEPQAGPLPWIAADRP